MPKEPLITKFEGEPDFVGFRICDLEAGTLEPGAGNTFTIAPVPNIPEAPSLAMSETGELGAISSDNVHHQENMALRAARMGYYELNSPAATTDKRYRWQKRRILKHPPAAPAVFPAPRIRTPPPTAPRRGPRQQRPT